MVSANNHNEEAERGHATTPHVSPHGELRIAHHLVATLFEAICEIIDEAQECGRTPVRPTFEKLFVNFDSVFLDHVAKAFAGVAEHTKVCGVWNDSCHGSVKLVGEQIRRILRPSSNSLSVSYREVPPELDVESDSLDHGRSYYDANLSPETVRELEREWPELRKKIAAFRLTEPEFIESSLKKELSAACHAVIEKSRIDDTQPRIHLCRKEPPEQFRQDGKPDGTPFGCVSGSKADLGYAIHHLDEVSNQSCTERLRKAIRTEDVWVRDSQRPKTFVMYLGSEPQYLEARERITKRGKNRDS
jgi:hypothetical protein